MREILFRGKRLDNGEWVEGYFAHFITCKQGKESYRIYSRYAELDCGDFYPDFWEVDPNSIRQYTGLTDKNGNKIFEGDILKIKTTVAIEMGDEFGSLRPIGEQKREDCAVVQEDKNTGGYRLKVYHNRKYKRISKFDVVHLRFYYKAEVIGNIHDNPELFGG